MGYEADAQAQRGAIWEGGCLAGLMVGWLLTLMIQMGVNESCIRVHVQQRLQKASQGWHGSNMTRYNTFCFDHRARSPELDLRSFS